MSKKIFRPLWRQLGLCLFLLSCAQAGMAQTRSHTGTTLSDAVTLAHGSYSSGGGLTIAAEFRQVDSRTALCGAWSESRSQSVYTEGTAGRLMRLSSVFAGSRRVASNLAFMPKIPPQLDYAGQVARCVMTDLPWRAGRIPLIAIPSAHFPRDGGGIEPNLSFQHGGPGAMNPSLELVSLLRRNTGLAPLRPGATQAEGRYSSGGGIRIAAEIRPMNGSTHLCAVWSNLPGQVERTEPLARELLRRTRALLGGSLLLDDLSGLRMVSARPDYTEANATCLATGKPWEMGLGRLPLTLDLPEGVVYRSTGPEGRSLIRFTPVRSAARS